MIFASIISIIFDEILQMLGDFFWDKMQTFGFI